MPRIQLSIAQPCRACRKPSTRDICATFGGVRVLARIPICDGDECRSKIIDGLSIKVEVRPRADT